MVTSVQHPHAPTPHPDPNCSSHCAAVMETTRAILRSDQKKMDEIKRVWLALASGEPILTDVEKSAIFASAEVLDMNGEYQEQEILLRIRQ
jgi:hypothetical protein